MLAFQFNSRPGGEDAQDRRIPIGHPHRLVVHDYQMTEDVSVRTQERHTHVTFSFKIDQGFVFGEQTL